MHNFGGVMSSCCFPYQTRQLLGVAPLLSAARPTAEDKEKVQAAEESQEL